MAIIVRNGIVYSGGGGGNETIELTMADYEARKAAGTIDSDIIYLITDANPEDVASKNFNGNLSDFFSISNDYVIGDYCIYNNQLYEFIEDKSAGDWDESKVKTITIKEKINVLKSDLEIANTNLSTLETLVTSLNETVIYIEENLGTLTTEEYTCSGTLSVEADWYGTIQRKVTFDRIFVEPPTIGGYYTYNKDNKFGDIYGTDVTTTSATVNIDFNGNYDCSATLVWTAMGLVRKEL